MNRIQRIILIFYCIVLAFVCLYVPWKIEFREQGAYLGYHLIWSRPFMHKVKAIDKSISFGAIAFVDYQVVVLEILAITAIGGMTFTLAGAVKKEIKEAKVKIIRNRAKVSAVALFIIAALQFIAASAYCNIYYSASMYNQNESDLVSSMIMSVIAVALVGLGLYILKWKREEQ